MFKYSSMVMNTKKQIWTKTWLVVVLASSSRHCNMFIVHEFCGQYIFSLAKTQMLLNCHEMFKCVRSNAIRSFVDRKMQILTFSCLWPKSFYVQCWFTQKCGSIHFIILWICEMLNCTFSFRSGFIISGHGILIWEYRCKSHITFSDESGWKKSINTEKWKFWLSCRHFYVCYQNHFMCSADSLKSVDQFMLS